MTRHSVYSASGADRWLSCPGSIRLTSEYPDLTGDTKESLEGSFAHFLCYNEMERWKYCNDKTSVTSVKPFDWKWYPEHQRIVTKNFDDSGQDMVPTDDMVEAVYLWHSLIAEDLSVERVHPKALENEVPFSAGVVGEDCGGTCDALFYAPDSQRLYVYEFKFGAGIPVRVERSSQLMMYALCAAVNHKYPLAEVVLTVVQPRIFIEDLQVQRLVLPGSDLVAFQSEIVGGIKASKAPAPLLNPGAHCQFCPVKSVCPVLLKLMEDAMGVYSSSLGLIEAVQAPAETLSYILQQEDKLKALLSAANKAAFILANNGTKIPGFKLVESNKNRTWGEEAEVEKFLKQHIKEVRRPGKLIPITEAEAVLKKKKVEVPEGIIVKPKGEPTLAPESDKRPEITTIDCVSVVEIPSNPFAVPAAPIAPTAPANPFASSTAVPVNPFN